MGTRKFNGTEAARAFARWIGSTLYRVGYLLGSSTAASTALAGTQEADTAFDVSHTIPAGSLVAGSVIRIRAQGIHTATTGAETHTMALKIGTTTIAAKAAIDPANSDVFYFDLVLTARTVGAGGTMVGAGVMAFGASGTGAATVVALASTALDTTVDQAVAVWIDRQAVATDGDSARLDLLVVTVE
ncbi:MAG: hypothetical protein ABMA64_35900 [Myxococcota bacterium]